MWHKGLIGLGLVLVLALVAAGVTHEVQDRGVDSNKKESQKRSLDLTQDNADAKPKAMSPRELIDLLNTLPQAERTITPVLIDKRQDSIPVLRDTILKGTPKQRIFAARLLADMRDKQAIPNLIKAAQEPEVQIRIYMINALGEIGEPNATPMLRRILDNSRDKGTLISTLIAIGRLGEKVDIKKLQKYLAYSDRQVRAWAAVACALLGDTDVQNMLIDMTYYEDTSRIAVRGLGYVNTPASSERLLEIITDPNEKWKTDARISLIRQELKVKSPAEQATILKELSRDESSIIAEWALEQIADSDIPQKKTILEEIAQGETKVNSKAKRLLKLREMK